MGLLFANYPSRVSGRGGVDVYDDPISIPRCCSIRPFGFTTLLGRPPSLFLRFFLGLQFYKLQL